MSLLIIKQYDCSLDQCYSAHPAPLGIALGVFQFDLEAESRLEKSSQLLFKESGGVEQSGRPAGARQDDYFPKIYVPENLQGGFMESLQRSGS